MGRELESPQPTTGAVGTPVPGQVEDAQDVSGALEVNEAVLLENGERCDPNNEDQAVLAIGKCAAGVPGDF